ncbi:MAG: hypothetical protein JWO05_2955 [Gemmatimonadetes bacterium]|nr:hypothetical protein [Gemmatimonadota bacterium]
MRLKPSARLALFVAVAACASLAPPPGGPERKDPPRLVRVTPDSSALNFKSKDVTFLFDEVVSDRPTGGELEQLITISPRDGAPHVSWKRDRITVRPRKGFRKNTTYTVTLLPGITDLRGNVQKGSAQVTFSTGPELASGAILGRVFDWSSQNVAGLAWVEAISRPDSIVYVAVADTGGQFNIGPLPAGTYTVRAILDANKNRALDPTELWDSTHVVLTERRPFLELLAARRDSAGPRILTVVVQDSMTFRASFDRPIDPAQPFDTVHFHLFHADSTPMALASVRTSAQDTRAKQVADSTQHADSVKKAAAAAPPAAAKPPAPVDSVRLAPSTKLPPPKPSLPAPPTELVFRLAPGEKLEVSKAYRVTATETRNLVGRTKSSERVFTVPKPPVVKPAAADTSRKGPPPDSASKPKIPPP